MPYRPASQHPNPSPFYSNEDYEERNNVTTEATPTVVSNPHLFTEIGFEPIHETVITLSEIEIEFGLVENCYIVRDNSLEEIDGDVYQIV